MYFENQNLNSLLAIQTHFTDENINHMKKLKSLYNYMQPTFDLFRTRIQVSSLIQIYDNLISKVMTA